MDEITHLLDTLGMARLIPHAAALAFAYGLALPIGWDREREERSAGLRTFPLVALASCGFVQAVAFGDPWSARGSPEGVGVLAVKRSTFLRLYKSQRSLGSVLVGHLAQCDLEAKDASSGFPCASQ
jgi:hypothetical protein